MFHSLREKLNQYDPYGLMRVNATQSVVVITVLIMIDVFYNLPGFTTTIILPILAFLISGTLFGNYQRIKAIAIFCTACIIYTVLFCYIKNYLTLMVLVSGLFIAGLFALSRLYSPLLTMIALIQVIASLLCQTPNIGDTYQLIRLVIELVIMMVLSIGLTALFPEAYFFRVWRRSLYFSLREIGEKLHYFQLNNMDNSHLLLAHLVRLFALTTDLSYRQHGFSARRISLTLTKIYTSLAALATQTISMKSSDLQVFINTCHQFCLALEHHHSLPLIKVSGNSDLHFLKLQKNFNYAIQTWNKLCLKR